MTTEEHLIKNREYLRQVVNFSGLRWGKITPTDIDAVIEFQDKVLIFIEAKHGESQPDTGQRLALERLCNNCVKAGKQSAVFIASHKSEAEIMLADCMVTRIYVKGVWRVPTRKLTIREAVDDYLGWVMPMIAGEEVEL